MDELLRTANVHYRGLRCLSQAQGRRLETALSEWQSTAGAASWTLSCNMFKGVSDFAAVLTAMPSPIGTMAEFKHPTTSTASLARE
eukprot:5270986-Pyramimonas_sp.AAC.1